jgi:hypothetical protein
MDVLPNAATRKAMLNVSSIYENWEPKSRHESDKAANNEY